MHRRAVMEYLDFDLDLDLAIGGEYPLSVRSPAGEAYERVRPPLLDVTLSRSLGEGRDIDPPQSGIADRQSVQVFGAALFEAVFRGSVRARFESTLHEALLTAKGVRIKLRTRAPELAALPWEVLYDREREQFLVRSNKTVLSRYLEIPHPIKTLRVEPPLRVLGVISTPRDAGRIAAQAERSLIELATAELCRRGQLELHWLVGEEARIERLQERLQEPRPWHILHFIGHGRYDGDLGPGGEGWLAFTGPAGETRWVSGQDLGMLLGDHPSLRLVVLNCCRGAQGNEVALYASTAVQVARSGVPAIVAMQRAVSDDAAVAFASQFYKATAAGQSVEMAVSEGRKAMALRATDDRDFEWALPVLHLRSLDGHLFELGDVPSRPSRPSRPTMDRAPPRWYGRTYVALGALITLLAALPLALLWRDEPEHQGSYMTAYPALFLFVAFIPLALVALYKPTRNVLGWLLYGPRRRRGVLISCLGFLIGFPTYAIVSERYKEWVAPWEVVRDNSFVRLEQFEAAPGSTTIWPAAFFALRDTARQRDALGGHRESLQQTYAAFFDNDRLLDGGLHLSRVGVARYGAVGAIAFVIALYLLDLILLIGALRSSPQTVVPADVFRGLVAALACLVIWVLMRLTTAEVDREVFGAISAFEQILPAVVATATATALAIVGLKDHVRAEWLTIFGIALGPSSLLASYYARRTIAALFSDLRMLGACFFFVLLAVVFLVSSRPEEIDREP